MEIESELTILEAAKAYGYAYPTVWRAIWDGRLPARRFYNLWFVKPEDVEAAIADGRLGKPRKSRRYDDT